MQGCEDGFVDRSVSVFAGGGGAEAKPSSGFVDLHRAMKERDEEVEVINCCGTAKEGDKLPLRFIRSVGL